MASPVVYVPLVLSEETFVIVGAVVSITKALLAARLVAGAKSETAFVAASAIVPEMVETVKSEVVSPAWTV